MRALETMAKWDFGTWIVLLYRAIAVMFQLFWFFKITSKTNDLEEQVFLLYASTLWCAFWPICLLKDLIFGND